MHAICHDGRRLIVFSLYKEQFIAMNQLGDAWCDCRNELLHRSLAKLFIHCCPRGALYPRKLNSTHHKTKPRFCCFFTSPKTDYVKWHREQWIRCKMVFRISYWSRNWFTLFLYLFVWSIFCCVCLSCFGAGGQRMPQSRHWRCGCCAFCYVPADFTHIIPHYLSGTVAKLLLISAI